VATAHPGRLGAGLPRDVVNAVIGDAAGDARVDVLETRLVARVIGSQRCPRDQVPAGRTTRQYDEARVRAVGRFVELLRLRADQPSG
jgi:hypothetical protein